MTSLRKLGLLAALGIGFAFGQRDFLTTDEADRIREVQEPNQRLQMYLSFARARLELIQALLKDKRPGRTKQIHQALEEYTRIIDTVDTVADDALVRGEDITEGLKAVAAAEAEFLKILEAIKASPPPDYSLFEFALENALETTADSREFALEDLGARKEKATERQKREAQEVEELLTPEAAEERRQQAEKIRREQEDRERKRPTLYRRGEQPKAPSKKSP